MSRQKLVCPFTKKTCMGCSVYRGRHSGLWAIERPAHASTAPSNGNSSDWVASLDTFFKDAAALQDGPLDFD